METPDGETDQDEILRCRKLLKERFLAHVFLKKACQTRYKKLLNELHHGVQQKRNSYPDTIANAYAMISECKDTGNYRGQGDNHRMSFLNDTTSGERENDGEEQA
eukprot:6083165-Ditylum_brightwellii.AAC.1